MPTKRATGASTVDITKGTLNESLAHPREIFRTVILNSAYGFILVHNTQLIPELAKEGHATMGVRRTIIQLDPVVAAESLLAAIFKAGPNLDEQKQQNLRHALLDVGRVARWLTAEGHICGYRSEIGLILPV